MTRIDRGSFLPFHCQIALEKVHFIMQIPPVSSALNLLDSSECDVRSQVSLVGIKYPALPVKVPSEVTLCA